MQVHCVYRSSIREEGIGCLVKEDQTIANVQYRAISHISNSMMQRKQYQGSCLYDTVEGMERQLPFERRSSSAATTADQTCSSIPPWSVGRIVGNLVNCFDTYWWSFDICWPQSLLHYYFLSYLKAHWGPHWGYRVFKSIYVILVPVNRKE